MRRIMLSILVLLSVLQLAGQEVTLSAWIDSSRIYIGDQVYYNIELVQPPSRSLILNLPADTIVNGIEVLSTTGPDTTEVGKDLISIKYRQLITSFDTGRYTIPPLYAEVKSEVGVQRYYSDYSMLEVERVDLAPADSTDVIFDIVGPREAPLSAGEIIPWVVGGLLVVVLAYFGFSYYRKLTRTKEEEKSLLPTEPLHIIALRELDKLDKMELWQRGKVKEHYSLLTETIRRYIDHKYSINSMEMTSSETLSALEKTGFKYMDMIDLLKNLLLNADLSKFAKYIPDNSYNSSSVELARKFVKETYNRDEASKIVETDEPERREEVNNG